MANLFHLAFPVNNISATKRFYIDGLGCQPGRESPSALIMNFQGHQLVAHVTQQELTAQDSIYPRHFGLVFDLEADWEALFKRAQAQKLDFYQDPKRRFAGTPLEHRTFFLSDPFHNLLEFKYYCHPSAIFGESSHGQVGEAMA
ncbi:VOC family protein [Leptothoe sp. PORK10 BA2]|uniref:VOC family protein n=1 Tax=Leptothoe sp. PORK10 BA2 TaxID=3110254 RepID=UPI002B20C1B0|nr:VOC family protein [Leptothoe sp. PORK10 BA2]MEA5464337.1 VOC family protein [Leptothoe sp. PORK10 BA2]